MSKRLTITIDLDNDAFTPEPWPELSRILSEVSKLLATGRILDEMNKNKPLTGHILAAFELITLRDINGNLVGKLELKEKGD